MGLDLFNLGHQDGAKLFYEQVTKLEDYDVQSCFNKGMSFSALERYEEAITLYNQAINIAPDESELYIHKAKALLALERHEEAITLCDQAITLGVIDSEVYLYKSEALFKLGRTEEAQKYWDLTNEFIFFHENNKNGNGQNSDNSPTLLGLNQQDDNEDA